MVHPSGTGSPGESWTVGHKTAVMEVDSVVWVWNTETQCRLNYKTCTLITGSRETNACVTLRYINKLLLSALFSEDGILHRITNATLPHAALHCIHVGTDVTVHVMGQAQQRRVSRRWTSVADAMVVDNVTKLFAQCQPTNSIHASMNVDCRPTHFSALVVPVR